MGAVTSDKRRSNFVSLGVLGAASEDSCRVRLWTEQVSRKTWCFRGRGCRGRGWCWPADATLTDSAVLFVFCFLL